MEFVKSIGRVFALTLKRLYDILATYLLFWVLYLAAVAVGLHFAFEYLWLYLGVANPELVWTAIADAVPLGVESTKLATLLALHMVIFILLRRPIAWLQPSVEKLFDSTAQFFDRITSERWSLRLFGESVFTVTVSALLIPFVIQPTLVRGWERDAWLERGGNLVNGRAVLDLPDSVIGYYRRFGAEAVVTENGVSAAELQSTLEDERSDEQIEASVQAGVEPEVVVESVEVLPQNWAGAPRNYGGMRVEPSKTTQPVMDRWDSHILDAVNHDDELFSYVKAFMYVESGGRQYAVSTTGCAGLMQFCAGTAKSQPYREIFGRGEVYACGCRGASCRIEPDVQVALESGDSSRVEQQEDEFPCELTDARFNPERALSAGGTYVRRLYEAFDGNVYLMYIGYNSGPGVARAVLRSLGNDPHAGIGEIEVHLTDALRPYYGVHSSRRAHSLTQVHLPKIQRALVRYGGPSEQVMLRQPSGGAQAALSVDATGIAP